MLGGSELVGSWYVYVGLLVDPGYTAGYHRHAAGNKKVPIIPLAAPGP